MRKNRVFCKSVLDFFDAIISSPSSLPPSGGRSIRAQKHAGLLRVGDKGQTKGASRAAADSSN